MGNDPVGWAEPPRSPTVADDPRLKGALCPVKRGSGKTPGKEEKKEKGSSVGRNEMYRKVIGGESRGLVYGK